MYGDRTQHCKFQITAKEMEISDIGKRKKIKREAVLQEIGRITKEMYSVLCTKGRSTLECIAELHADQQYRTAQNPRSETNHL